MDLFRFCSLAVTVLFALSLLVTNGAYHTGLLEKAGSTITVHFRLD